MFLIRSKSKKNQLFRLGLISSKVDNAFKNYVTLKLPISKRRYGQNYFFMCTGDIKKTWNQIRNVLSQARYNVNFRNIVVHGTVVVDDVETADTFNQYIGTVAESLDTQVPSKHESPLEHLGVYQVSSVFMYTLFRYWSVSVLYPI